MRKRIRKMEEESRTDVQNPKSTLMKEEIKNMEIMNTGKMETILRRAAEYGNRRRARKEL